MACFHFYREFLKPPLSPLNSPQLCLLPAHCFPECPWPVVCGARPGGVPETGEEPTLPSGSLGAVHTCPDEVGLGPRPPHGAEVGRAGDSPVYGGVSYQLDQQLVWMELGTQEAA